MISPSSVQMWRQTDRPFSFDCYKKQGVWKWRASCQFSLRVSLHPNLQPVERNSIEYRQFITGGIWVRYHSVGDWTPQPNFNKYLPIPPYKPQHSLPELPTAHVPGPGLSWEEWKEDGKGSLQYGYRTNQPMFRLHERDQWMGPNMETGSEYYLRDTPSVAAEWVDGTAFDLWIGLYFLGYVVEVERDERGIGIPVRVLKSGSWDYHFDGELSSLSKLPVVTNPE